MRSESAIIKTNRLLLLFIILLDIIGFSLIFPLIPDLLEHYIIRAAPHSTDRFLIDFLELPVKLFFKSQAGQKDLIVLFGGLIGSIYSFLQFLTSPYWGRLSDRQGRRNVLLLTSIGMAFSYVIWFFSSSFLLFTISRIIGGLMAGNLGVATAAIADMSDRRSRTGEMALVGAVFGLGFIIGPALGGLASRVGLTGLLPAGMIQPFSFVAFLAFLASTGSAFLNYRYFRETYSGKQPSQWWCGNTVRELQTDMNQAGIGFIIILYFLFILIFSGFEFTVSFFYKLSFRLTPLEIGMVFFYMGVLIVISQGGLVRRLSPLLGEKKMALAGMVVMAPSLYALGTSAPVVWLSLLYLFPLVIGSSFVQPALTGLVSIKASAERQGITMGVFRSSGSLARALGPMAGAVVYWIMGAKFAYFIMALLLAALVFLSLNIKDGEQWDRKK